VEEEEEGPFMSIEGRCEKLIVAYLPDNRGLSFFFAEREGRLRRNSTITGGTRLDSSVGSVVLVRSGLSSFRVLDSGLGVEDAS
jgi:hypothetical protein